MAKLGAMQAVRRREGLRRSGRGRPRRSRSCRRRRARRLGGPGQVLACGLEVGEVDDHVDARPARTLDIGGHGELGHVGAAGHEVEVDTLVVRVDGGDQFERHDPKRRQHRPCCPCAHRHRRLPREASRPEEYAVRGTDRSGARQGGPTSVRSVRGSPPRSRGRRDEPPTPPDASPARRGQRPSCRRRPLAGRPGPPVASGPSRPRLSGALTSDGGGERPRVDRPDGGHERGAREQPAQQAVDVGRP